MKNSKIKICFIISGLSVGGAETMLFKLLINIDKSTFSPYVISLTYGGHYYSKIQALGLPIYTLNMKKNIFAVGKLYQLIMLIKRIKPDIVHTWMYHADLLGGIAAKVIGIRNIVWSIRQSNFPDMYENKLTLKILLMCSFFSKFIPKKIISCSANAKQIHIDIGYADQKISVIPNGFDLSLFAPDIVSREKIRRELSLSERVLLVGFVARYDKQKNHLGFLKSASAVLKKLPDTRFVFAGHDVDYHNKELITQISQENLSQAIFLLGERSDVASLLASIDLLVLPSSYGEGFPNIVGEAMACGIPCVVTDVGDSAELVHNPRLIVSPNNADAFSDAIISLLQLPSYERTIIGKSARERILKNYEIKKITKIYEKSYLELMEH